VSGPAGTRRDLGRRLAGVRKAAGYTQEQLAVAAGYSRSAVSNAEIGHPEVARAFWARCDAVLRTGRTFTVAFDQVKHAEQRRAAGLADAGPDSGLGAFRLARKRVCSAETAEALAGYQDLGWAVQPGESGLELATGDVLDALELPRAAGMLAMSLWLYSQGRPDQVRQLPALPHPARALVAITAGDRCYFLTAAGGFPWTGSEPAPVPGGRGEDMAGAVIRWHARGGRIPVPPSRLPAGERAAWAYLPARPVRLAPAIALLGLLGTAAAAAGHNGASLTLPGGIRVIPAPARPAVSTPEPPAGPRVGTLLPHPARRRRRSRRLSWQQRARHGPGPCPGKWHRRWLQRGMTCQGSRGAGRHCQENARAVLAQGYAGHHFWNARTYSR
jgi:transcriptional regulator with XRE-family HTH domain